MAAKTEFSKIILIAILFLGLFFCVASVDAAAESEGGAETGETAASGAAAGAGAGIVPGEIQQQLNSIQQAVDNVGKQAQSVKEKGIVQTIWDNVTAPVAAIFRQIGQILGQISAIFGAK